VYAWSVRGKVVLVPMLSCQMELMGEE
jgi:hypothetical protein